MAIRINRERLNDAMSKMMSFYMQNKLGEMSNQRYMGTISEQDRLMRERNAEEDVRKNQYQAEGSRLRMLEDYNAALLDAVKDPVIDGIRKKAQIAEMMGDQKMADVLWGQHKQKVTGFVNAATQAQGGAPLSVDQVEALIESTDIKTTMDVSKEGGVNRRFGVSSKIDQQQANTSAGNLALQREKAAQSQTGQVPQDEYYKLWHAKIEGVKKVILGFKEAYASPDTTTQERMSIEQILSQVQVKPTEFLKSLADLNKYDTIAMTKRLSPQQEMWLDNFGGFGENNPEPVYAERKRALEDSVNESLEAENQAGTTQVPSVTIPANAPKAYNPTTGETAYWDGSKWIIVK